MAIPERDAQKRIQSLAAENIDATLEHEPPERVHTH